MKPSRLTNGCTSEDNDSSSPRALNNISPGRSSPYKALSQLWLAIGPSAHKEMFVMTTSFPEDCILSPFSVFSHFYRLSTSSSVIVLEQWRTRYKYPD